MAFPKERESRWITTGSGHIIEDFNKASGRTELDSFVPLYNSWGFLNTGIKRKEILKSNYTFSTHWHIIGTRDSILCTLVWAEGYLLSHSFWPHFTYVQFNLIRLKVSLERQKAEHWWPGAGSGNVDWMSLTFEIGFLNLISLPFQQQTFYTVVIHTVTFFSGYGCSKTKT